MTFMIAVARTGSSPSHQRHASTASGSYDCHGSQQFAEHEGSGANSDDTSLGLRRCSSNVRQLDESLWILRNDEGRSRCGVDA